MILQLTEGTSRRIYSFNLVLFLEIHHVRFINSCTINCMQDNLQLSCFCGLTDTGFSSVQLVFLHSRKACRRHGFCTHSATSAHAAAHKAHMPQKKAFLQHMGLNAGGAEVHLSCKNIQPGHVKPAVCWQNSRKILVNWKLCCTTITITMPGKWLAG